MAKSVFSGLASPTLRTDTNSLPCNALSSRRAGTDTKATEGATALQQERATALQQEDPFSDPSSDSLHVHRAKSRDAMIGMYVCMYVCMYVYTHKCWIE